ncbi:uncharacterized protein LOC62_03G003605 [Vanrija pseudolonga]|uniref:Mid2 domain-containing protein n=1 Tax=Vanrija pseudolonga TaxID=143232 RepID=A0AAF0Y8U6_9TREE|nr:hypothetical protein LOC62_03G003605 [Vanrija pseudolonga]
MILRLPRLPRLFALAWLAQAAAQDLFINDPDNPMSCFPVAMRWSGGVSPYTVYVLSAASPSGTPIELAVDHWTADVKGLAWYIDIVQGAELVLKIVDGAGASATTNAFTVRPPADPLTCARFNLKDPSTMTLTGSATTAPAATAPTTGSGSGGGGGAGTGGGSTGPTSAPGSPPHTDSSAHGSSNGSISPPPGTTTATSTPMANTPASPNDAKPGSVPLGPIVGGAIVGGVVVFVVMFGILIYCRRKRHLHENGTDVEGNHPYPSAHLRRKSLKFDEITTASNLSNDDFASHVKPTRIGAISPPLPLQISSRPATPVMAYEYVTSPRTPNRPRSPQEKTSPARPTSPSIMRMSVISPLNNDSLDDLTQGGASGSDGHAADRSSTSESGMSGRPTYSRASTFTAPSPSGGNGSLARLVNTTRTHRAGTGGSSMSMTMGMTRPSVDNMPATPPRAVSGLEFKEWTDWAAATNHSLVSSRSSYSRM